MLPRQFLCKMPQQREKVDGQEKSGYNRMRRHAKCSVLRCGLREKTAALKVVYFL